MYIYTHPDAVVPGLALRLHGTHSQPVADSSGSLRGEAWNSVCYGPHLKRTTALSNHVHSRFQQSLPPHIDKTCSWWLNPRPQSRDGGCGNTDLVQWPHGNLGDVVRDELPGGALWVAGCEALSVPQVTYMNTKKVFHRILNNYFQESLVSVKGKTRYSLLSSTAKTEVRPTDSCLRVCRGGDGMWYQHSPVEGPEREGRALMHVLKQHNHHWPLTEI